MSAELEHIRLAPQALPGEAEPAGVFLLTVAREKALNALDERVMAELGLALDRLEAREDLRGLVITGAGERAFVAGADLRAMEPMDPRAAEAFSARGHRVLRRLVQLPVPTIAAVNGFALGGGLELALACDVIVASEKARLGLPEVSLGLIPGFGGTQTLVRRVGLARAKEVVFSAEPLGAEEALALGLVARVVPAAELLPAALALMARFVKNGALALAQAKRALNAACELPFERGLELERVSFATLFATEDRREGFAAFFEKRAPRFPGR